MTYEDLRQHGFPPSECDFILKTIHREVELYTKALYMACSNREYLVNVFLQKAREE